MKQSIGALLSVWLGLALFVSPAADAEDLAKGTLVVEGKAVGITRVYAYARPGFFDKRKQDVVVLLCDAPVPAEAVRDVFGLAKLIDAGTLHCVQQTINTEKQVINYEVKHKRFGMPEGGASSYHVFTAKTFDDRTIAGRAYTTSPQESFEKVPYSYDITFTAAFDPMLNEKTGKKLPAGGGDLGKAYLAQNRKILSTDVAAVRKAAPPGELDKTPDEEIKTMLELTAAMTPKDPKITEGYINAKGDRGLLSATGMFKDQLQYGTIEMEKKNGEWVVTGESWGDAP